MNLQQRVTQTNLFTAQISLTQQTLDNHKPTHGNNENQRPRPRRPLARGTGGTAQGSAEPHHQPLQAESVVPVDPATNSETPTEASIDNNSPTRGKKLNTLIAPLRDDSSTNNSLVAFRKKNSQSAAAKKQKPRLVREMDQLFIIHRSRRGT